MSRGAPKPLEHDVQATIKQALELAGCDYFETTAYRQKGSSGVDKGVPDLLVTMAHTPLMLGLEVKRPGKIVASTFSSTEQRDAWMCGRIVVARTPREALEHVAQGLDLLKQTRAVDSAQERVNRVLRGFPLEDGRDG